MIEESLKWSSQLHVAPQSTNKRLQGDKIALPQSALEALLAAAPVVAVQNGLARPHTTTFDPYNPYSFAAERLAREALADRQQQLPHPLTFRLVNPENGRAVYAGIREFSAEEGEIGLSSVLQEALAIKTDSQQTTRSNTPDGDVEMTNGKRNKGAAVTVHHRTIPKGTYVKLRPLEAGYDPEDWKSLLERYLRDNFTTLTANEILTVPARNEKFRFLVDKVEPEGEAICIVDTDLEVDIEAMNEAQARETLSKKNEKLATSRGANRQTNQSSFGGIITLDQEVTGQLEPGDHFDVELKQWDKSKDIQIRVDAEESHEVDVFVNPFSSRLRSKPRWQEYTFADFDARPAKRLKLSHTNVEIEGAEHINISLQAWDTARQATEPEQKSRQFTLTVIQALSEQHSIDASDDPAANLSPDDPICKNCTQSIPKARLALHEAFCYRNNTSCPRCHHVFLKNSEAWKQHWHCPHDDAYGNDPVSKDKHDFFMHPPSTFACKDCGFEAYNVPILAQHRVSTCPAKEIVCQFCHLLVPQQGPEDPAFTDAEVLMSGMTPHEYADGARTTECHICSRIVRLRDMRTHLRLHDRERLGRASPLMCGNGVCGRTIRSGDESRVMREQLGLCNECFGPLYITTHDPEGKALRRRVERRLLQQLMSGCGKSWCHNAKWCRTGHKNSTGEDRIMTARDALPRVRPVLEQLAKGDNSGLSFCVDEAVQLRHATAEMVAAEGVYELAWCIKALEEEHNDLSTARAWLSDRAPRIGEIVR